ncbi:MAG: trypsin-like peptidase domain-containing protein [Chloroflexi bacterium]|nr:trypsin-like peptidase domain-containing protein [Chloroflexota bacterium]
MRPILNHRLMRLAIAALATAGLACNIGQTGPEDATPPPAQEQISPDTESEVEPVFEGGAVSSLQNVRQAVVQIEAQGTFVDPEFGLQVNSAGRGSGFIIDPSGIAVTNNHVVTGAALLKVWVGGESEPRNARVLGVSECSDLAVIDIEGDNHPYLDWYEGSIDVGLEIYSAGFPLGDPEFTLTKGIVSKASTNSETNWASLDSVLVHDATINPGNSGGPLVDSSGRIVGVNFASNPTFSQYFAIPRDVAAGIIDQLRRDQDVDSIGVNGKAVVSDDGSLSGVWVSSVASGSAADRAGVQPGDILTTMEGLSLATDGTMADYCNILRTKGPDATLSIEVLRYEDEQYLQGQINGRPLEASFSFEAELGSAIAGDGGSTNGSYSSYVSVSDDLGTISVEIPSDWADVDGSPWVSDGKVIGAQIKAAVSVDDYLSYWDEPGMFFGASDDLADLGGYIELLDIRRQDFLVPCELDGRYDYEGVLYRGKYDLFFNCGGEGGTWLFVLTTVPRDDPSQFVIMLEIQIVSDGDLEAVDRILESFEVVAALP